MAEARTTYTLNMEHDLNIIIYEGPDCSFTMANLAEGDYVFKVRASNNLGAGEWSEPVYVSVLEDGTLFDPYSKSERKGWQQARQEELRQAKRQQRKRKEQKKKDRMFRAKRQSEEEKLLARYKQTSQQLFRLITKEKFEDLQRLLDHILSNESEEGLNMILNSTNSRGETPIIVASMRGNTEAVQMLLKKGARYVNLEDTDNQRGRTPLIWAVINGSNDMLIDLIRFKGRSLRLNVNWQDYGGYTALHWAADLGNNSVAGRLLHQPGVDTEIKTYDASYTPLHFAAANGHLLIVQQLYSHLAKAPCEDAQPEDDENPIGNAREEETLSPAFLALMKEHYDVAAWLISAEERRLLSMANAAIREMKTSLIHLAAMLNREIVQLLISGPYPADVNAQDEEGNTPLPSFSISSLNGSESLMI